MCLWRWAARQTPDSSLCGSLGRGGIEDCPHLAGLSRRGDRLFAEPATGVADPYGLGNRGQMTTEHTRSTAEARGGG
jgi:hypothetical protein